MIMRIVLGVLFVALLGLQYRLWVADSGLREVWRLEKAIDAQQQENATLSDRNSTLAAEVRDLKEGRTAIEERARTDLGMIGANETFFQVIGPSTPPPEAAADKDRRTAQAVAPPSRK
jgi:cell division protein FtsB